MFVFRASLFCFILSLRVYVDCRLLSLDSLTSLVPLRTSTGLNGRPTSTVRRVVPRPGPVRAVKETPLYLGQQDPSTPPTSNVVSYRILCD